MEQGRDESTWKFVGRFNKKLLKIEECSSKFITRAMTNMAREVGPVPNSSPKVFSDHHSYVGSIILIQTDLILMSKFNNKKNNNFQ